MIERWPKLIDAVAFFEIELQQRGVAAHGLDFIIKCFECVQRPRGDDNVCASFRQTQRNGTANATRCACDKRDAIFEGEV